MCFFPWTHRLCVTALMATFDLSQGLRSSFTLSVCFETGSHGSWTGNWGQPWILDPSSLECWDYRARVRVYMVLGIKPRAPSMLDMHFIRRATSLAPLVFKIIHWLQVTSHLFVVSLGTWASVCLVSLLFLVCLIFAVVAFHLVSLSVLCCCSDTAE